MLLLPRSHRLNRLVLVVMVVSPCFLATGAATAAKPCSKVTKSFGTPVAELSTALRLDVRRDARPTATSTVTAAVPAAWPEVATLREWLRVARRTPPPSSLGDLDDTTPSTTLAPGGQDWPVMSDPDLEDKASDALDCLVPGLDSFGNPIDDSQLAVTTSGGRARIVVVASSDLERATNTEVGPWRVSQSESDLVVTIEYPTMLAGALWSAILDVQGAHRLDSVPTPHDDDGRTHVQWRTELPRAATELEAARKLQAVVALPWPTAWRVGSEHKPVRYIFLIDRFFLLPLLVALLAIIVILALRPLRVWRLTVGVALLIMMAVPLLYGGYQVQLEEPLWNSSLIGRFFLLPLLVALLAIVVLALRQPTAWRLTVGVALLIMMAVPLLYGGYQVQPEEPLWKSSLILLLFVSYYLLSGRRPWTRVSTIVLVVLLILAGLLLPALWNHQLLRDMRELPSTGVPPAWSWVRLAAVVLLLVTVSFWAVWGTVRLVDRLLQTGGLAVSELSWKPRTKRWARRATIAVAAAFGLGIAQIAITRLKALSASTHSAAQLASILPGDLLLYQAGVAARLLDFVPFLALAALLSLLHAARASSVGVLLPYYPRARIALALIFAGLVVGVGGELYGLALPISFVVGLVALMALLGNRLADVEKEIANADGLPNGWIGSIVVYHQRELLARARDIDTLRRAKAAAYAEYSADKLAHDPYLKRLESLDKHIEQIREDGSPSYPFAERLWLPKGLWPHGLALTVGPAGSWWSNGVEAAKTGSVAALVPLALYAYVLLTRIPLEISSLFGPIDIVRGILQEMAFWLIAAFVFGCAYAHLPGENGMLKAVALTVAYGVAGGAGALVQTWAGNEPQLGWIFRGWQLLLFLSIIGIWLDRQTVIKRGLYWRDVLDAYRVRPARAAVTYLVPLIVSLIGIGQQLRSGDAQTALVEAIKSLSNLIPVG